MKKLGLAALLLAGFTGAVAAADLLAQSPAPYCAVAADAGLRYIGDDARLRKEVVRLMDEAVAVAGDSRWVGSRRPVFLWASEAKVACGKAYGYLQWNHRDEDYLTKCGCFHARMVEYMR